MARSVGLSVRVHPAFSLFKQGTEVPALQRGNLEMSTMTTFEVAQQIPELGFLNRGYLFRDYDHLRRVFDGPVGERLPPARGRQDGDRDPRHGAISAPARSELRKKRAVAGAGGPRGRQDAHAGRSGMAAARPRTRASAPVPMGMPEVYLALKTGAIDGQENPLSIFNAAKLYEVSEQVVLTSHMVQPVFFSIAKPSGTS